MLKLIFGRLTKNCVTPPPPAIPHPLNTWNYRAMLNICFPSSRRSAPNTKPIIFPPTRQHSWRPALRPNFGYIFSTTPTPSNKVSSTPNVDQWLSHQDPSGHSAVSHGPPDLHLPRQPPHPTSLQFRPTTSILPTPPSAASSNLCPHGSAAVSPRHASLVLPRPPPLR